MSAIQILNYIKEYQQGVLDLILDIQQNEFGIAISVEDQPDLQDIPSFYQQGLGNFWVCLADDVVVGTVALIDIGKGALALRKMFVQSAFRGKQHQVAQSLLAQAIGWAKSRNIKDIYLGTTAQFVAAHRFYEKNGFNEIVADDLPDNFPRMQVDSRFFRLSLAHNSVC